MQTRQRPPRSRSYTPPRSATTQNTSGSVLTLPNLLSLVVALGVIGLLVVMFPLDWLAKPNVTVALDRSAFSPNGDGVQEEVAAFYTLSEGASVTVVIENSVGLVVRRLINEQGQTDGQHAVTWNGRDDSGQFAPDGLYQISVTAAGTARQSEHRVPVEVDTTPPTLQLANFSGDLTTRTGELAIEGTTDPNVTLTISGDPQPVPVDARGVFRVNRLLNEGLNPFDIRATDAAGNSTLLTRLVTLRTQPPTLTITAPAENASFVSQNLLSVAGTVPPDVTVSVNGKPATVDAQGNFTIDFLLGEGDNNLEIVAADEVGNETRLSRRVTLRSQGPTITLTSVPDGMTVRDPSLRVTGTVDPGVTLQVNSETVPVDANGNFSALVALQGGNNLVTVTAQDVAGNINTIRRTVHYATGTADSPSFPTIALPNLTENPMVARLLVGSGVLALLIFLFTRFSRPLSFDVAVDSPTFYPNRNDDRRLLVMRLYLSRNAKVDLEVYDELNRHVSTLQTGRRLGDGEHFRLWDGRNDSGQLLPAGSYLIQATARAGANNASSAVWVRLDPSPPRQPRRTTRNYYEEEWADESQLYS